MWVPTTLNIVVSAWWYKTVLSGGWDDILAESTWIQLAPYAATMDEKRGLLLGVQRQLAASMGASKHDL
jgi:hypothetical protein